MWSHAMNAQHASDDLEAEKVVLFLHAMPARTVTRARSNWPASGGASSLSALRFPVGLVILVGADVPRLGPRHHHGGHRDGRLQHHHRRLRAAHRRCG